MKKSNLNLLLILAMSLSFAFRTVQTDLEQTQWLIGTWEQKTARGNIFEAWVKASSTEFRGRSYAVSGKDTVVFENIRLAQRAGGLFYIPTVKNQNGGNAVSFKAKFVSPTEMVFENPAHDFPQQISYKKINKDSLVAKISGTVNGKFKSQQFQMRCKQQ